MNFDKLVDSLTAKNVRIYSNSFSEYESVKLLMIKVDNKKFILAAGEGHLYDELQGEENKTEDSLKYKLCELSHANRFIINKYFDYTAPRAFGKNTATIGLGDRLGIASPGHIKTIREKDVKPVLAQQSIRELNLTGRTYKDVLDAAAFAVFQEGYKGGYGADGDHLKVEADIKMSLDLGFTMITLDCSEKIDNTIEGSERTSIEEKYSKLGFEVRKYYEEKYLGKTFNLKNSAINFDKYTLIKNVLIYRETVKFVEYVYENYIKNAGRAIDFEISIDETLTPTTPEAHFFVANELYSQNIDINSMAPRFCGEFQKGIDYKGDLAQFEREFIVHAEIADKFGYKLSIHSGSDKFSVFPIIGKYTEGRFHVKTAGTNWLEAVRVVAKINPDLYRRMHQYAFEHFDEARAYYHVTADINAVAPLSEVSDDNLPSYMDDNNARQLIHITYGILLQAKDRSGKSLFKDEFFKTLSESEEEYNNVLINHIGKHISLLGK